LARTLRPHPKDKQPVELHAGRYGPYVKHGGVNATLPDKDRVDAAKAAKTKSARRRRSPSPQRNPRSASA